jgi:hypothetical protein
MPDTIPTPHCGAPAHSIEQAWLDSTHGPIQHRTTGCMSKHWRAPAPRWPSSGLPTPIATWRRCAAGRIRWGRWSTPAAPTPGTRAGW